MSFDVISRRTVHVVRRSLLCGCGVLSTGLVLSVIGPALAWSGYLDGVAQQSTQTLITIRLLIALLPALLLSGAIMIARAYPITRQRHAEVQAAIARQRSGLSAGA